MNLFNLFATLTLDNSDYEKKINQSEKTSKSFSSKIGTAFKSGVRAVAGFINAAVAATTAVAAFSVKIVNSAGDIVDNANKLQMSTEGYQFWGLALQRATGDANSLQTVVKNLDTFTTQLSEGQGEALLALQQLGIGYEDFMAMPTEDKLTALINGFQGLESGTDKTALAQQIFGARAYQELLPMLNAEQGSLELLKKEFEELGLIVSDDTIKNVDSLGDSFDKFTNTLKATGLRIVENFVPELGLIAEGLAGVASGSDNAINKLTEGFNSLLDKVLTAAPTIIEKVGVFLVEIIEGILKVLPNLAPKLVDVVMGLLNIIIQELPKMVGLIGELAFSLIDTLAKADWGTLILNLLKSLIQVLAVELPTIKANLAGLVFKLITDIFSKDGLKKLGDLGVSIAEALVNGLIDGVETGLNIVIKGLNEITKGISKIWTWTGADPIPPIPTVKIPRVDFEEGGMFDDVNMGTMYLARAGEAGAEIVATGRRGTGVANVDQIAEAQYTAMRDYDLRGAIREAVTAVVNGIVDGLKSNEQDNSNAPVVIRIGDKDFKGYIVSIVNSGLKSQGLKSLRTVTAYTG